MCLSKEAAKLPAGTAIKAWKVFTIEKDGLYSPLQNTGPYKVGDTIEEANRGILSGFHAFPSRYQARDFRIKRPPNQAPERIFKVLLEGEVWVDPDHFGRYTQIKGSRMTILGPEKKRKPRP